MKIIGLIPARYHSSRLPGKPLLEICGKPMVDWVYEHCKEVKEFDEIYVLTEDVKIFNHCRFNNIPVLMTSNEHITHVDRVHEISKTLKADYYVVVCGDEPLIRPSVIEQIIPSKVINDKPYVANLCRYFSDPSEVIDPSKIKVYTNKDDEIILLTRSTVPFPYKRNDFKYKKIIGVECYNKVALDLFKQLEKGELEIIEDVTLQRYLENNIKMKCSLVDCDSFSVNTERELEKVREMFKEKLNEKS